MYSQHEGPISACEKTQKVGAAGSQGIIYGMRRRDDAASARRGGIACKPAHDIASLLGVERLYNEEITV